MKSLLILILIFAQAVPQVPPPPILGKDWKRAIWRVPMHFALSVPVVVITAVVPPVGKAYVRWRIKAEQDDVESGSDTSGKAAIDLYSQTVLVNGVLKMYHIKTQ